MKPSGGEITKHPVIVAAAVIRDGDRVLVTQRPTGPLAGKWEFPGGKLKPGESPERCLVRELREELGVEVGVSDIFAVVYHEYDFGPILLLAYSCWLSSESVLPEGVGVRWASQEDLLSLEFVPADRPVAEKIAPILAESVPQP